MSGAPATPGETLRLHQANERTMLAWIRTGIALMAFGFAIARFAIFLRGAGGLDSTTPHVEHGLGTVWVGAVLVALGMLANLVATVRYGQIRGRIERGEVGAPNAMMVYLFGATVTLVGLAMTALLLRALDD